MIQFIYADGTTVWDKPKSNIRLSYVAGIYGPKGMRVVVTRRAVDFKRYHVGPGERCLVVPDLRVEEPVAWGAIPFVIQHTRDCVNKHVAGKNHCGECRVCCTTLYVKAESFTKPSHQPCQYIGPHGCKIYAARPEPCKHFQCMWLKSQSSNDPMPLALRPDHSDVLFTPSTLAEDDIMTIEVHPIRGKQMSAAARTWLDDQQARGMKGKLVTHYIGEHK